jgi:hypothetical protein
LLQEASVGDLALRGLVWCRLGRLRFFELAHGLPERVRAEHAE